jgi:polyisoprenoid-binding protein YceI
VLIRSGTHRIGPDNATLSVLTGRAGAAAKAGHDLVIRVTSWEAALVVGEDPAETSMELTADATSLRVVEGSGGMQPLGEDDVANIHQTIDEEVLRRQDIKFRSTRVQTDPDSSTIHAEGDLTLVGKTGPIAFDLTIGEGGELKASAVVTQSAWGMNPYSALLGALKVKDDVLVVLEGHL